MSERSSAGNVTVAGNTVRGPESRRADAEAALDALGTPGVLQTDGPAVATYTDFDPEPTWIMTLVDADEAMKVKERLDRRA